MLIIYLYTNAIFKIVSSELQKAKSIRLYLPTIGICSNNETFEKEQEPRWYRGECARFPNWGSWVQIQLRGIARHDIQLDSILIVAWLHQPEVVKGSLGIMIMKSKLNQQSTKRTVYTLTSSYKELIWPLTNYGHEKWTLTKQKEEILAYLNRRCWEKYLVQ